MELTTVYWGECDGCGQADVLLRPFVHRPTGVTAWLCMICDKSAQDALGNKQVPGLLEKKLKEITGV